MRKASLGPCTVTNGGRGRARHGESIDQISDVIEQISGSPIRGG